MNSSRNTMTHYHNAEISSVMTLKPFMKLGLLVFAAWFTLTSQAQQKDLDFSKATIIQTTENRLYGNDLVSIEYAHRQRRQTIRRFLDYNIVYVIDSSSSISKVDFKLALEAIQVLTEKARPNTKYAAVMFASNAQVISGFTTPEEIVKRLRGAKRMRGGTNNYAALKACGKLLRNSSSGLNPKALNRIVMITDGLFNMNKLQSIKEAFQLKLDNIDIFVIAVGRYHYGSPEISSLASTHDSHVFKVKTMNGIVEVVKWNPYFNPWEYLDKVPPEP